MEAGGRRQFRMWVPSVSLSHPIRVCVCACACACVSVYRGRGDQQVGWGQRQPRHGKRGSGNLLSIEWRTFYGGEGRKEEEAGNEGNSHFLSACRVPAHL